MKNIILISLTISGLLSVAGSALHDAEQATTESVYRASEGSHAAESIPLGMEMEARDDQPMAAAIAAVSADEQAAQMMTINGLSIYDNREAVIEKLGEPQSIATDDFFAELVIYEYPLMSVAFQGDVIYSIDVSGTVETLHIDQVPCPATIEGLTVMLGEPDFRAEDGIVFQRAEALLKLYLDDETEEIISFSYYHIAMV